MKDKVVIITGASSGIGKALAFEFGKKGARLALGARNTEKLEEVARALHGMGVNVISIPTDVSKESDCKILVDKTIEKFGTLDILVNNAGISMRALFEEADLNVLKRLMDTNFWGTVYCTKYALPYLLGSKGTVVGISSIAGFRGLPGRAGYSASKFAMNGFLEVLRTENRKKGLHVLIASPGFTSSNIRNVALSKDGTSQGETPLDESKLMSAEEVAARIVRAVERKKILLVLTGQGKLTVWMNKFFPRFMDRMVYNHMAKEPDSPFK